MERQEQCLAEWRNHNYSYNKWRNIDILTLLFKKKGERDNLKNNRSIITIINMDFKIFTEILMKRLVKALGSVIGEHQSVFLSGRLIDDKVRTI